MSTAPSPVRAVPAGELRPEIQALRAFAVLVVLLYHLWPGRLTGGFIGVDIFFVVSGFLITAHLVRELRSTSSIRLGRFWARRARRLLPASFFVLAVTAIGVLAVVPMGLWQQFFREIGASALYVENWALAADSVDYLAAENVPSPVQHYWSLGVEEQLYLVWPLLLVAVSALLRRRPHAVAVALVTAVAASLVASLAYSSTLVAAGSATAYFVTPGRVWEFAAGGLLALSAHRLKAMPPEAASALAWMGWAGLVSSVVLYGASTPFPGYGAIPAVVFTLLVLAAGAPETRLSPSGLVRLRPIQWVGDVSYSTYLWHWPLIILVPFAIERDLTTADKLGILIVTFALAWFSTRFVENPIRFARWSTGLQPLTVIAGAVSLSLLFAGTSAAAWSHVQRQNDAALAAAAERERLLADCFGAGSLATSGCDGVDSATDFAPNVAAATDDVPAVYAASCRSETTDPTLKPCVFGDPDGRRVALLGDSHAASWFPALNDIAERRGWSLTVYFKGACAFSMADRTGPPDKVSSCLEWNRRLLEVLRTEKPFDLVFTVTAAMVDFVDETGRVNAEAAVQGFHRAWKPLLEAGSIIVPIRDLPMLGEGGAECQLENPDDPRVCERSREEALALTDFAMESAARLGITSVDMTDYFCDSVTCRTVAGGVLVYRDSHHFTATYSRSLAPYLERELISAGIIDG